MTDDADGRVGTIIFKYEKKLITINVNGQKFSEGIGILFKIGMRFKTR